MYTALFLLISYIYFVAKLCGLYIPLQSELADFAVQAMCGNLLGKLAHTQLIRGCSSMAISSCSHCLAEPSPQIFAFKKGTSPPPPYIYIDIFQLTCTCIFSLHTDINTDSLFSKISRETLTVYCMTWWYFMIFPSKIVYIYIAYMHLFV